MTSVLDILDMQYIIRRADGNTESSFVGPMTDKKKILLEKSVWVYYKYFSDSKDIGYETVFKERQELLAYDTVKWLIIAGNLNWLIRLILLN